MSFSFLKSPHKSDSFRRDSISKLPGLIWWPQTKGKTLFLVILLTFSVFIIFMIFRLMILLVLLTPTKYCFQDQVTSPSDRLWVVNQTFTKLDMVYSDFLWSPLDMVSVLILDSQKYGHHQFYLYPINISGYWYEVSGTNRGKAAGVVWKKVRLSRGAQTQGKVWLPEGPPVGKFPDNSLGFSTVSQTSGFKNRRKCVPQELSEHIPGFKNRSLTVLMPDFGFGKQKSVQTYR